METSLRFRNISSRMAIKQQEWEKYIILGPLQDIKIGCHGLRNTPFTGPQMKGECFSHIIFISIPFDQLLASLRYPRLWKLLNLNRSKQAPIMHIISDPVISEDPERKARQL